MVKHIILWKLKEGYSAEEVKSIKENAKRELEGLVGKIDGLENLTLEISGLPSSTADMMLNSEFVSGVFEESDTLRGCRHFCPSLYRSEALPRF